MKIKDTVKLPELKTIPDWGKLSPLPPTDYERGLRQGIFDGIMEYNELLRNVGELNIPRPKLDEEKIRDLLHLQLCHIEMLNKEIGEKNWRAGRNVEEPINVSKFLATALCEKSEEIIKWGGE